MTAGPTTDLMGALGLRPDQRAIKQLTPDEIPPRQDRRHKHGPSYTDAEMLDRVERWDRIYGAPPTKTDWHAARLRKLLEGAMTKAAEITERIRRYEEGDWPSEATVRDRFGSVNALRERAGYPTVAPGRQPRIGRKAERPAAGEPALRGYFRDVAAARQRGDRLALKSALLTLALSALREADRLDEPK